MVNTATVLKKEKTVNEQEAIEIVTREATKQIKETLAQHGYIEEQSHLTDEEIKEKERVRRQIMCEQTKALLVSYKDIVWALSAVPDDIEAELNRPLDNIGAVIESATLSGSGRCCTEEKFNSLNRSKKMIQHVNNSLAKLKTKPCRYAGVGRKQPTGEELFEVIYKTYIDTTVCSTQEEVIEQMGIAKRTYYRRLKCAILALGEIVWGAPTSVTSCLLDILAAIENGKTSISDLYSTNYYEDENYA